VLGYDLWGPTRSDAAQWSSAPGPSRRSSTTSSPGLSRFPQGTPTARGLPAWPSTCAARSNADYQRPSLATAEAVPRPRAREFYPYTRRIPGVLASRGFPGAPLHLEELRITEKNATSGALA